MSRCAATWERCSCGRSTCRWEAGWGNTICASLSHLRRRPRTGTQRRLDSCDHYVEPDYRLGFILQTPMVELIASEKQRAIGQDKLNSPAPNIVGIATCSLPVTASVRATGSSRPRMASLAQLPVRRLYAVLQPHRPPDENHGRPAPPGPLSRRDHAVDAARDAKDVAGPAAVIST
jgi:hypothetical protein